MSLTVMAPKRSSAKASGFKVFNTSLRPISVSMLLPVAASSFCTTG